MEKTIFGQKCILYNKEEKKLLVLERSNYKQAQNLGEEGYYDMIGGSVNWQEDSKESIIREAKEECNIDLINPKIIDLTSRPTHDNKGFFIFGLYFCDNFRGEIKLSHEHKNYKWISIEEIKNYEFRITLNEVLETIIKYITELENKKI